MKSVTTQRFRECYALLPDHVKETARKNYQLWKQDPSHPSIHFKQVHPTKPIYSARVGLNYRVLGTKDGDTMIWFWIGSHTDYDRLTKKQ